MERRVSPTEALDKKYNYKINIKPTKKKISLNEVISDVEFEGIVVYGDNNQSND